MLLERARRSRRRGSCRGSRHQRVGTFMISRANVLRSEPASGFEDKPECSTLAANTPCSVKKCSLVWGLKKLSPPNFLWIHSCADSCSSKTPSKPTRRQRPQAGLGQHAGMSTRRNGRLPFAWAGPMLIPNDHNEEAVEWSSTHHPHQ